MLDIGGRGLVETLGFSEKNCQQAGLLQSVTIVTV